MSPSEARSLELYDVVRIIRLIRDDRHYLGTRGAVRAPEVGDVGSVFELLDPKDPEAPIGVECVDDEGHTAWIAEFIREELEFVRRP